MTLHVEHPRYDETNMPASQPIAKIGWVADCKDGAQEQARAIARARKEALRAAVVLSCLPALCGVSIHCPALPCPAKEEIISACFNDPDRRQMIFNTRLPWLHYDDQLSI